MSFHKTLKALCLVTALSGVGMSAAHAGLPSNSFFSIPTLLSFPATSVGAPSAPLVITVVSSGTNTINSMQLAGTNAADFALVAGGTCAVGGSVVNGTSCTQNVRFTPSAPGARLANFMVGCSPTAVVGGFQVICATGIPGILKNLDGTGIALAVQSVPALDGKSLTAMALLMMALASYFGFRRNKD